jgi:hypothetical protein
MMTFGNFSKKDAHILRTGDERRQRQGLFSTLFVLIHMLRIKRNDKGTHLLLRPFAVFSVDSYVEFSLSAFGGAYHIFHGRGETGLF